MDKEQYIKSIIELLKISDKSTLEFIFVLLQKTIQ